MAEEFPLPSSSYKELIKIIRAYGRLETEANLADVAKKSGFIAHDKGTSPRD
jgi:hypothetical protein